MTQIEILRQFKVGEYAVFDLVASFLGIYLLAPLLSKIFLIFKLKIPKSSWIWWTLPIGILTHLLVGTITPMTENFINFQGGYGLKILIAVMLVMGVKGIRLVRKTSQE